MFDPALIIALIVAVTVHEFCHAWTATYLGDPTAKYLGRLSLNPLAHLDPIGTLMLLLAGFGWGKPVPFNMAYLKNPRVDAALIALSGPLSNLVIALIFALPYRYLIIHFGNDTGSTVMATGIFHGIETIITVNLVLMVFNLLPLPPLDGSKVFSLLLPGDILNNLHQYRHFGYGALLLIVFSDYLIGVNILSKYILGPVVEFFWRIILFAS
jgi:Zn-dependent protease